PRPSLRPLARRVRACKHGARPHGDYGPWVPTRHGGPMLATAAPQDDWFAQFGIDSATAHAVLQAATLYGADDADLYFEHSTSTSVGLSDRAVNRAHSSVDLGVGVRVVVGDQV